MCIYIALIKKISKLFFADFAVNHFEVNYLKLTLLHISGLQLVSSCVKEKKTQHGLLEAFHCCIIASFEGIVDYCCGDNPRN